MLRLIIVALFTLLAVDARAQTAPPTEKPRQLDLTNKPWTGRETTTYVRNIFKYYVSYKLTNDARERSEALKQQVAPGKK